MKRQDPNPTFNLHAAIATWLLPGMGHIILGQRKRGVILMITISTIWTIGLLIGGMSVIDSLQAPENKQRRFSAWYLGQSLIAPSLVVNWHLHKLQDEYGGYHPDLYIDSKVNYQPSYGKVGEQGILYTALAGLLNLLAILDVIYCDVPYRRNRDRGVRPESEMRAAPGATGGAT